MVTRRSANLPTANLPTAGPPGRAPAPLGERELWPRSTLKDNKPVPGRSSRLPPPDPEVKQGGRAGETFQTTRDTAASAATAGPLAERVGQRTRKTDPVEPCCARMSQRQALRAGTQHPHSALRKKQLHERTSFTLMIVASRDGSAATPSHSFVTLLLLPLRVE